jgi:RecB family exonuclease
MVPTVEWVRFGADAAAALRARIAAAKGGDPLAPVTVVVPSNHVGVATRRLLAAGRHGAVADRGTGLAAVTFVTVYRLAELLGAPALAAEGRRPVSTPVIAAALRAQLAAHPGLFAPVAAHPATEAALVAAYRELRELSPTALDALAATGPRAADVVRLHRGARARLEPAWYDEQDLMRSAARALSHRGSSGGAAGAGDGAAGGDGTGPLVLYLPQRLSRHAVELLSAAAAAAGLVVVAGATGDPAADAEVTDGIRRLAPGAAAPPLDSEPDAAVDAARTRILTASDADDETRHAARAVLDAVRAGTPLDRIAVVHASPDPYARLAHEHLRAAGVATNGAAVVPLSGCVAGRVLLGLLALPERGFRRQDVFAWLSAAPVRDGGRWAPVVAWERLSRDAGVVAGRPDWDRTLARLADDLDARASAIAADPDQPEWRAVSLRDDAERARRLRAFVLRLVDDLAAAAAAPRAWSAHARWARRQLDAHLGGAGVRQRWPAAERKSAERVDAALDRLAALDGVEAEVDLAVFVRTLALELDADLGRVGRFGEGVLVGSVAMAVGLDLDLVVVLGLAEGTFPAPVRDDSLLPDHDREAAGGELPLRRTAVDRQHRQLLAALAGAGRQVLTVPRGDLRRSAVRFPSRWVLDVASRLAGARWWPDDLERATVPWVEHVPSFDAGLRALTFAATDQEHRLRSLMAAAPADARALAAGADDRAVAAGARAVAERRSARFTRFDGNLAGLAVPSPVATATSATRLERWAGCPFAYLVHDVLGVEAVENPEDALRITPLDWGNLVHGALDRFMGEVLARPVDERPAPHEPWPATDRARLAAIGEELCADYEARGLTGRPVLWRRDRVRILADLQRFLTEDDRDRRERGSHPLATELAFGLRGSTVDAVPIELPDGRQLRFRGKADRIDVADDGHLHVVDYKTGRPDAYARLSIDDPDQRGRHLQLVVYGAAARQHRGTPDAPVRAEYWFVSAKGGFKRIGYPITDEVVARVASTLGSIVTGIESGVFPAHPTAVSTSPFVECPACDPDALGVAELRRAWDAKSRDPALALYAALAEPLAGVEPDLVEEAGGA